MLDLGCRLLSSRRSSVSEQAARPISAAHHCVAWQATCPAPPGGTSAPTTGKSIHCMPVVKVHSGGVLRHSMPGQLWTLRVPQGKAGRSLPARSHGTRQLGGSPLSQSLPQLLCCGEEQMPPHPPRLARRVALRATAEAPKPQGTQPASQAQPPWVQHPPRPSACRTFPAAWTPSWGS